MIQASYESTASYEKLIPDVEVLQNMIESLHPTDFGEDEQGFDAIKAVETDGHFIASEHTLARYETAFSAPGCRIGRTTKTGKQPAPPKRSTAQQRSGSENSRNASDCTWTRPSEKRKTPTWPAERKRLERDTLEHYASLRAPSKLVPLPRRRTSQQVKTETRSRVRNCAIQCPETRAT